MGSAKVQRCITLISFVLVLSMISFSASSSTFLVRANPDYFPVTYQEEDEWNGMDVDLITEIFARTEFDFEIISKPFQRSLLEIEQGTIQLIPNLTVSDERSKFMNWLGPVRTTCIGLVVQEKDLNVSISSMTELVAIAKSRKLKIGHLSGASYSKELDEFIKEDSNVNETLHFLPSNSQHRSMLQVGRLFGYFFDAFEVRARSENSLYANNYEGLALHPYRIEGSCAGAFIGVSKKLDEQIYSQLIRSFESIKEDGTFRLIHKKWMGHDPN